MANDLKGRPWVLDTAGGGVLWKGWIKIKNIEFVPTVDTDTATITDQNGRSIVDFNGKADLSPSFSLEIGWVQGFNLATLVGATSKVRVFIV